MCLALPLLLPSLVVPAAWQFRFGASIVAGMTPLELTQWETTLFSGTVPPVAVQGRRLYANYLGHIFALEKAEEAYRLLMERKNFGKVVLKLT